MHRVRVCADNFGVTSCGGQNTVASLIARTALVMTRVPNKAARELSMDRETLLCRAGWCRQLAAVSVAPSVTGGQDFQQPLGVGSHNVADDGASAALCSPHHHRCWPSSRGGAAAATPAWTQHPGASPCAAATHTRVTVPCSRQRSFSKPNCGS